MPSDVLVVGAGPAGSLASLVLARAGARVRLVDRSSFPRDKLCGDTLNPGSLSILDRLGIAGAIRSTALPIDGMTVSGPGGVSISAGYPHGFRGVALPRREIDIALLGAAVAAGAVFDECVNVLAPRVDDGVVTGVRVATADGGADLTARVVIAADGRASRLARAVGLAAFARTPRRWAYGAYVAGVTGVAARGEMHIRPDGYIGLAPLPSGLTNVCVVRDERTTRGLVGRLPRPSTGAQGVPSNVEGRSGAAGALEPTLALAIESDPLLRDRFTGAEQITPLTTLGPLAVDAFAAGVPGLLLAGDAAGFVDPMTGDGMRFALRGGELAAEAALQELATGRPAHDALYRTRGREFARKWRLNRGLRALVDAPPALRLAAVVSGWWDWPVRTLIAIAGDVDLARTAAAEQRVGQVRTAGEHS